MHTTAPTKLSADALAHFTGTEVWHRHPLVSKVTFTDGVKYVADTAGAYWLVDEIALAQVNPEYREALRGQDFQSWKLKVDEEKHNAVLICEDGDYRELLRKDITFTDFPLPEITLWFTGNVILLPSEY